jgi:hypothetical protein
LEEVSTGIASSFGIVSYCSLSYLDAFEFSIDSWLRNGGASEVVIFTDNSELPKLAKIRPGVRFISAFTPPVEEVSPYPWQRKIETVIAYYRHSNQPFFAYLDCDCWIRKPFWEVFNGMRNYEVVGTRFLGRDNRGKGEANAGVIFFRRNANLGLFFDAWSQRSLYYKNKNKDRFYDQDALSHLIVESFDGLHPFRSSLVSERIYNCEHDMDALWLQDVQKYVPKILHFKGRRFRNRALVERIAELLPKEGYTLYDVLPKFENGSPANYL